MKNTTGFTHWVIVILISVMAIGLVGVAWYYEENKEEYTTVVNTNTAVDSNTNTVANTNTKTNINAVVNSNTNTTTNTIIQNNTNSLENSLKSSNTNSVVYNNYQILYEYSKFYPEEIRRIYKASLDGSNKIETSLSSNVNRSIRYSYYYDKDYLIQTDGVEKAISIIPLDDITQINTIVSIQDKYTHLGSIFPIDESRLVYIESRETEPEQYEYGGPREQNIYTINIDGTNKNLIYSFILTRPSGIGFKAFNQTTNEVYWTEGGGGGCSGHFTTLNILTGEIRKIETAIPDNAVCSIVFNEDHSVGYYLEDRRKIVEYNFISNTKTYLYETPEGMDANSNSSFIRGPLLSPDENKIAFSERLEPSDKEITKLIDVVSKKVITLLDDERYYNIGPSSWSPDSNYLWLDTNCRGCGRSKGYDNDGEYYLLDITSNRIITHFIGEKKACDESGQRCVNTNERLNLIGWLEE